ncbi:MAG: hypothetical protein WAT39_10345 [Planctomycetota bacterium]
MKRLLAFLVLLALGIAVLRFAIGDEGVTGPGPVSATDQPAPPRPGGEGIPVRQGSFGATVTQTGPLKIPRWRPIDEGGGRVRKEEIFVLAAADSRPVGNGVQQLDGVQVQIFDRGRQVATMNGRQAFVELQTDARGELSFDEAKDIDLREVVVTSLPDGPLGGVRLELGDAKVRIAGGELLLTTDRDQPVLMTMAGERTVTLRGKGAQARFPRDRNSALRAADVEILHEPVLEADGLVATAKGRLHLVEDLDSGTGKVTLDDQVVLELADGRLQWAGAGPRAPAAAPTAPAKVSGDQFTGWLLHSKTARDDGTARSVLHWRQLVLTGAPARVELPELRLDAPKLTVLPGVLDEPFLITAHGGAARFELRELRAAGQPPRLATGSAQRRIHLASPGQGAGAFHRSFGFPRWSLAPLDQTRVVVAEGAAQLVSELRTVDASDGVRIVRREGADGGIARGFGTVAITQRATNARQQDLLASGNDGFTHLVTPAGEWLYLGAASTDPGRPAPPCRFDVRYGDSTLRGLGTCVASRSGDLVRLDVSSPDASLHATMPGQGLDLRGVHRLTGTLAGETLGELDVAGWPVVLDLDRAGERATARAPRIVQIGPQSFRLLPPDDQAPTATWSGLGPNDRMPALARTIAARDRQPAQSIDLRGPCIDVHRVGGDAVLVDAVAAGAELPEVFARVANPDGGEPTTIACSAERLRLLPFLTSPWVRRWHLPGGAFALDQVTFHASGRPWLLVDAVRTFELDDPRMGHVTGTGHRLLVSQGGRAAVFFGDPDNLVPARVERTRQGRTITTEGARVRVLDEPDGRLEAFGSFPDRSTFLAPTITLHEPGRTGLLSHMRATCRGNIDVRQDAIVFAGPVQAQGLRADGSDDPDGVHLDARELTMQRQLQPAGLLQPGDIVRVVAKDVTVDWTRLDARCAEIELDLQRSVCIAKDPGDATVLLPNGIEIRAPQVEVNWETMTMQYRRGRIARRLLGEAGK